MAAFTVSNAGGNWSAGGTWVGGVAPANTDTVVFAATSGNLTVDGARTCAGFDCTNFVGTLTVNGTLRVNGNVTLVAAMTITNTSGTPTLQIGAAATLTSNGKAWPYSLTHNVSTATVTLADAWVTQNFSYGAGSGNSAAINGFTLTIHGNLTVTAGGNTYGGTTEFILDGTGTFTTGNGSKIGNPITINTAGLITFSGTALAKCATVAGASTGNFTIVTPANTTGTSGVALVMGGGLNGSISSDLGGLTWASLTLNNGGSGTYTYTTDVYVAGNMAVGNGANNNLTIGGAGRFFVGGNVTFVASCPTITTSGTNVIVMSGVAASTATLSMGGGTVNKIPITFAASGTATINVTGTFAHNTGTLTYTSGNVNAGTSTLLVQDNTTINTAGMSWNNVTVSKATTITITLNSTCAIAGTLLLQTSTNYVFAGTAGFTCQGYQCSVAGATITHQAGATYTTTGSVSIVGSLASPVVFKSSSTVTRAIWTLNVGATQTMVYVNGQYIDSGLGQTIWSFGAALTSTINWNILGTPRSIGRAYVG